MPVYEYYCEECKKIYEIGQRISEEPIRICPHCGSGKFKRIISATSFVLKGSGWYKTDYTDYGKRKKEEEKSSKSEAKVDKND